MLVGDLRVRFRRGLFLPLATEAEADLLRISLLLLLGGVGLDLHVLGHVGKV